MNRVGLSLLSPRVPGAGRETWKMEVDGESPGDRETEVKREVWDHLPATLESHKGGGGEGRGPLRVRRLAFCQGAPKVWVFLGIFSGADQTHEGIERCPPPGTPPDSGTDHCPDPGGCCFGDGVCLQPAPPLAAPGHGPCPAWGGTALAPRSSY